MSTPGYSTDKPCELCGATPAYVESRFGYVACESCHRISPVQFSRLRDARATIPEFDSMFNAVMDLLPVENPQICYQCDKAVKWLAPDGRCDQCTRLTPEEIRGE